MGNIASCSPFRPMFLGAPAFERCAFTTSPFCGNSCHGVSGGGGGGGGVIDLRCCLQTKMMFFGG